MRRIVLLAAAAATLAGCARSTTDPDPVPSGTPRLAVSPGHAPAPPANAPVRR